MCSRCEPPRGYWQRRRAASSLRSCGKGLPLGTGSPTRGLSAASWPREKWLPAFLLANRCSLNANSSFRSSASRGNSKNSL